MANSNLYIGVNHDSPGFGVDATSFTIQGTAPATDFYFYSAATDANGNVIQRSQMITALQEILNALQSNNIYTSDLAQ